MIEVYKIVHEIYDPITTNKLFTRIPEHSNTGEIAYIENAYIEKLLISKKIKTTLIYVSLNQ